MSRKKSPSRCLPSASYLAVKPSIPAARRSKRPKTDRGSIADQIAAAAPSRCAPASADRAGMGGGFIEFPVSADGQFGPAHSAFL